MEVGRAHRSSLSLQLHPNGVTYARTVRVVGQLEVSTEVLLRAGGQVAEIRALRASLLRGAKAGTWTRCFEQRRTVDVGVSPVPMHQPSFSRGYTIVDHALQAIGKVLGMSFPRDNREAPTASKLEAALNRCINYRHSAGVRASFSRAEPGAALQISSVDKPRGSQLGPGDLPCLGTSVRELAIAELPRLGRFPVERLLTTWRRKERPVSIRIDAPLATSLMVNEEPFALAPLTTTHRFEVAPGAYHLAAIHDGIRTDFDVDVSHAHSYCLDVGPILSDAPLRAEWIDTGKAAGYRVVSTGPYPHG
jgi:hypothetical protein